jgi:hypothetical protein
MTPEEAVNECDMQQKVWSNSIIGGRPEICPSIVNLSMFVNRNDSMQFLYFLHNQFPSSVNPQVSDIFQYLFNTVNITQGRRSNGTTFAVNFGLGIITMPLLVNSYPLHFLLKSNGIQEARKIQFTALVIAQLVRLFMFFMVIHLDAHSGNVMVSDDQAYVIDFGNSSFFGENSESDRFFDELKKREIFERAKEFQDEFFELCFPKQKRNEIMRYQSQEEEKINFMRSVLTYMISLDKEANNHVFSNYDADRYQMEWLDYTNRADNMYKNLNFHFNIFDVNNPVIYRMLYIAFSALKHIQTMGDSQLPRETIQSMFRQGYFTNFAGRSIRDFIVAIRRPQQEPQPQNQAVDMIDSDVESDTMETPQQTTDQQTTDQQPEEMNTSGGRKLKRKTRTRKRFTKKKFTRHFE